MIFIVVRAAPQPRRVLTFLSNLGRVCLETEIEDDAVLTLQVVAGQPGQAGPTTAPLWAASSSAGGRELQAAAP
jgi:hypothetical protein